MASGKIIWRHHTSRAQRIFVPPLAIGMACALFIVLILTMGILDLRRSEKGLVSFLENQGLAIIEVVQRLSQENLDLIVQAGDQGSDASTSAPQREEALYPKTWLTTELLELGREVDNIWQADHLGDVALKQFATERGLWLVIVMNKQQQVVFQNRFLPADFFPAADTNAKPQQITLDLLTQLAQMKKIGGYIALKQKNGSGIIIIALDKEGLIYRGLKVSVQKAIEKLGEGQKKGEDRKQGLIYMTITNKKGMLLGKSGRQPEKWRPNDMHIYELLAGAIKMESRQVLYLKKNILDMAAPLYINGKVAGIVRIGLDKESTDSILKENTRNLIFFMIIVVFITIFSMWFLYHNQNRHLAGIVEIERRLEKAERLSALGQLAAGVAHEIRNPLNAISMASQRLKRDFTPADEEKGREFQLLSGVIRDEIRRLNGIIEEFLSFSKTRRLELRNYPVTEVLQKIINLIREEAGSKGITIKTEGFEPPVIFPMDMDKLQQALLNFFKNAMESITGAGEITIAVKRMDKGHVVISIADTGCGISPEEMEQIFNPEYTTKEKGLGLGLALAHEIIRGHGGEIRIFSTPQVGTTFEIMLPTAKATEASNNRAVRG
ncbi:MAG: ATP-binding protein [Deltaproteobacteria bacterium]|nr:ATP-binding protein [Deltaproteobacteria bacterium]